MNKRVEGFQDLPSKVVCLAVPRNFVGETFFVALVSGTEKVWIRGGVIRIFCRKIIVSQRRNFLVETVLCFTIFGYRKGL